MKIYADTCALIAWFHPADEFAGVMADWRGEGVFTEPEKMLSNLR